MKRRHQLAALAFGLIAAFALAELALRVMGLGFGSSPMEPDPVLHHVHPRSYTFTAQHPSGEVGGFPVEYNSEGRVVRGTAYPGALTPPSTSCRVALMGDSFVEAGQVPFPASFGGLLEQAARTTCEVRNYGVRSYSPAIYLVQWTREVRAWKPSHVFVLVFDNDIREDADYMTHAVMGADGWPTAIQGPSGGWLVSQLRRSYVARFVRMITERITWAWQHQGQDQRQIGDLVEENPQLTDLTAGLIRELNRRIQADGAQMVLMVVPSRYRLLAGGMDKTDDDLHKRVKAWAEGEGVRFLDLNQAFERAARQGIPLFFRQDIHFTEEGHALAAAVIAHAFPELFPDRREITGRAVTAAYGAAAR